MATRWSMFIYWNFACGFRHIDFNIQYEQVLRHRWHFFWQIIYPHRALFIDRVRITLRAWNSDKGNQHESPSEPPMCALVPWGVFARSNMIAEHEQCPFNVAFLLFHIHFIKLFIVWMRCILRLEWKKWLFAHCFMRDRVSLALASHSIRL